MAKLVVCISIMLVLLAALSESSPFCCTEYQEHQVPLKFLKEYRIQEVTGHCNIKAAIFRTVKNRYFCADPSKKWVKTAMKLVPEKL